MSVCTCRWSPVNTATIDPPHIVAADPNCPFHRCESEETEFCPHCDYDQVPEGRTYCPNCGETL